jgi:flavorubredoxin
MSQPQAAIDEVGDRIYRISTPVEIPAGAFSFNQYLIDDEEPLLFHTGLRGLFPAVAAAIGRVMPLHRLRHVGFSHFEADECGSLNQLLAAAPGSAPLCGQVAAMVSVGDYADRPPRALADGESVSLGYRRVTWLATPHLPHAWECGFLFEETSRTLLCGDLFTQGGAGKLAVTESDILGPSEAFRRSLDYFAHAPDTRPMLERLAALQPTTLACMHGSAWRGDGGALIRALADSVEQDRRR